MRKFYTWTVPENRVATRSHQNGAEYKVNHNVVDDGDLCKSIVEFKCSQFCVCFLYWNFGCFRRCYFEPDTRYDSTEVIVNFCRWHPYPHPETNVSDHLYFALSTTFSIQPSTKSKRNDFWTIRSEGFLPSMNVFWKLPRTFCHHALKLRRSQNCQNSADWYRKQLDKRWLCYGRDSNF